MNILSKDSLNLIQNIYKYVTKKKLIIFIPHIRGGGVEKNFFSTIKNLKKSGIKLFVICCSKKKFNKKLKINDKSGIFQLDKFPLQAKLIFSFLFLIYYNFRKKYPILSFQGNVYAIIASKIVQFFRVSLFSVTRAE